MSSTPPVLATSAPTVAPADTSPMLASPAPSRGAASSPPVSPMATPPITTALPIFKYRMARLPDDSASFTPCCLSTAYRKALA